MKMVAIKDMEMPKNCVECNHMDLQQAINCQLIYSGCANCGRHPNCPLIEIEERKEGKWIYHEKSISTAFKELRECSCCHCYFRWEMSRNSYCPNCGADMRGNENEVD